MTSLKGFAYAALGLLLSSVCIGAEQVWDFEISNLRFTSRGFTSEWTERGIVTGSGWFSGADRDNDGTIVMSELNAFRLDSPLPMDYVGNYGNPPQQSMKRLSEFNFSSDTGLHITFTDFRRSISVNGNFFYLTEQSPNFSEVYSSTPPTIVTVTNVTAVPEPEISALLLISLAIVLFAVNVRLVRPSIPTL